MTIKIPDATTASHWKAGMIKHIPLVLNRINHITPAVIPIFFQNVAQLDRMRTSPKHPQCSTGFSIAIHRDSGSMKAIIRAAKTGQDLRKQPNNRKQPTINSTAHKPKAPSLINANGTVNPKAPRYSSILKINPHGSTALTNPEYMKSVPHMNRTTHVMTFINFSLLDI